MDTSTGVKTNPNSAVESFATKFKKIYLGEDLDGFMQRVDKDAVWTFMATGEQLYLDLATFAGVKRHLFA